LFTTGTSSFPIQSGETTEKVGGKQGLKIPNIIGSVLYTLRGKNRKNDERYYWKENWDDQHLHS
jgi:hypothetical protein